MLIIDLVKPLVKMLVLTISMKPTEYVFPELIKKMIRLRSKNKEEVIMC